MLDSTTTDLHEASSTQLQLPSRGRFEGVANVVRFNWPIYLVGMAASLGGFAIASWAPLPGWLKWVSMGGAAVAMYLLLASLLASYWVYDRSSLYSFVWAKQFMAPAPKRIVNLHSGFDESSIPLLHAFPDSSIEILDFYDCATMTEPSIARARRYQARTGPTWLKAKTRSTGLALPLPDESFDAAFLILALHEVRQPQQRLKLAGEVARVVRSRGRVIVVEHLRDTANFLVFGPQYVHFYSARTWRELAPQAKLRVVHEFRITPFVGVFIFEKRSTAADSS